MSDFVKGIALEELKAISIDIAMRSKIKREDALAILTKIGFYEERYGAKPYIHKSIIELANQGCSPEHIFAAIKLLPGDKSEAMNLPDSAVKTAKKILEGNEPEFEYLRGKRAVDL